VVRIHSLIHASMNIQSLFIPVFKVVAVSIHAGVVSCLVRTHNLAGSSFLRFPSTKNMAEVNTIAIPSAL
jgi:hypothetical protein